MSPESAAGMRDTLLQWSAGKWRLQRKFSPRSLIARPTIGQILMLAQRGNSKPKTVAELVDLYDQNFKRAADRIRSITPEQLATPINFIGAFDLPAVTYLAFFNNHRVHHRGQLSVYLRPMGSKCPAIYGASFDERSQRLHEPVEGLDRRN